ncbi:predicted protein [Histoplasma capsulatum var. duboisii H88]|uniref:Predicted protein n=1 Tax=Ajellomyces capsulatus (strain H88) TaxID=544711 RepID=F0UVP1_AJEC8|nr:predicted protein [Histoplasma capsulatum var. duboisii H88]
MATCEVVEELHRGGSSGVTTSYCEFCSALLCSALLCSALHPPSPSPDDSTQRRTAATAGGGGAMTLAGARHIIIIITIILASTSDDQVLRGMVYTIAFVCATRETVYSVEYQSLQSRRGMNE